MTTAEVLARVHAYWEGLIRPALREQADRITAYTGRRPAPCDMVVVVGETAALREALRPGAAALDLGEPITCLVSTRVREAGPHRMWREDAAAALTAGAAVFGPGALIVAWVEGHLFAVEALLDVVDTGPEGATINAPAVRGAS